MSNMSVNSLKKSNPYLQYFDFVKNPVFPKFLIILFMVEMWERFSYYGLRNLLFKHLLNELNMNYTQAYFTYSLYAAIGYALPILGGILADKFLGFVRMVVIGSSMIALGHFLLFFSKWYQDIIFAGLAFIALGTGFFKGNITNLLGLCYSKNNQEKKIAGFTLFYVAVNVGSFSASIICGYANLFLGWHIAFSIAGIGMLIGLVTFSKYKHIFSHLDVTSKVPSQHMFKNYVLIIVGSILVASLIFGVLKYSYALSNFFHNLDIVRLRIIKASLGILICFMLYAIFSSIESKQERKNITVLFIFVVFFIIFYIYEMHLGSLFVIFMDKHTNNSVFSIFIPSEVSQAINPMAVVLFGFFMSRIIKSNIKSDITNFFWGISTITICFSILFLGTKCADKNYNTQYIFPFLAIVAMSMGEVLIAPFLQSKTTELAPKKWKGLTMGLLMGCLSISNILGGIVLGDMFAVDKKPDISQQQSLDIYSTGFLKIIIVHSVIVAIFFLLIPLIKKLLKGSKNLHS